MHKIPKFYSLYFTWPGALYGITGFMKLSRFRRANSLAAPPFVAPRNSISCLQELYTAGMHTFTQIKELYTDKHYLDKMYYYLQSRV
jgi:hypothetical protein